jgi:hypothetical protein
MGQGGFLIGGFLNADDKGQLFPQRELIIEINIKLSVRNSFP